MSLDLKNLSHVERDVGQHIKSSKKHFIWEFLLDGKSHKIELYDSRISGKKKLLKDGQVWKEVEEDVAFSKTFEIGKHSCTIIQHGEKYELRIDNQSFNHLMDLERNKVFFTSGANPTSTVYTAKPVGKGNKIEFGMGNVNNFAHNDSKQKPSGLFNFSIKPANPNQNHFSGGKFNFAGVKNESSGHSRRDSNSNSGVDGHSNNNNNNALLIDFSTDLNNNSSSNPNPSTESKVNTFNLLETINFQDENVSQGSNHDYQQQQFSNPNMNSVNFNENLTFSQNFNHGMNNDNNMNYNYMGQFNQQSQHENDSQDQMGEVKYPTFDNYRMQNNMNMQNTLNMQNNLNNNSSYNQASSSKDPLADLFG